MSLLLAIMAGIMSAGAATMSESIHSTASSCFRALHVSCRPCSAELLWLSTIQMLVTKALKTLQIQREISYVCMALVFMLSCL